MIKWIVCCLILLSVHALYGNGRDSVNYRVVHFWGGDLRPAYTFPTDCFFKGENMENKPIRKNISAHLKYGFKFLPAHYLGKYYPYATQGIGIGYNTFGNPSELGCPLAVYVFQSSRIVALTSGLSLDYEWNFGASFGWKKYDEMTNFYNRVVGSKINAYINVGLLLKWELSCTTHLRMGVGLTHYSNGNTHYPNAGVNTVGGSIGFVHYWVPSRKLESFKASLVADKASFRPYVSYDIIVYGATKKKGILLDSGTAILVSGSFAVAGINFNPLYNFSRYFRAGVSLDLQYDESANIAKHIADFEYSGDEGNVRFYRPSAREQYSAGLSVRAEVVMPFFSINLGVGKNFICKGADTDSYYQIFALKADVTKNLFLHAGYQLYRFKDPNHLMLGIGFRFNARKGRLSHQ